jgi:hypothetical protein
MVSKVQVASWEYVSFLVLSESGCGVLPRRLGERDGTADTRIVSELRRDDEVSDATLTQRGRVDVSGEDFAEIGAQVLKERCFAETAGFSHTAPEDDSAR